jgi:hypothetical protein
MLLTTLFENPLNLSKEPIYSLIYEMSRSSIIKEPTDPDEYINGD